MQQLSGISYSTYQSNPNSSVVVINAIASTMDGVSVSNIQNLTVTAATTSRRRLQSSGTDAIDVSFVVRLLTETTDFNSLKANLKSAVSSGDLSSALATQAASYGVSGFSGVTASVTQVQCQQSCASATDDASTSEDKKWYDFSLYAIIGIAVGGAAALIGLSCFVYCCFCRAGSSSPPPPVREAELPSFAHVYPEDSREGQSSRDRESKIVEHSI